MVARMTLKPLGAVVGLLAALLAALLPAGAQADAFPDPTRPAYASVAAESADVEGAPIDALQLQSILLGKGRTPAAVISGQLVVLGGQVRDARLVRLTERTAILKTSRGETTLSLTPLANKQGHPPATPELKK
jgi:MSHA biogenesis protein MshK